MLPSCLSDLVTHQLLVLCLHWFQQDLLGFISALVLVSAFHYLSCLYFLSSSFKRVFKIQLNCWLQITWQVSRYWDMFPTAILLFNFETRSHEALQVKPELWKPRRVSNLKPPCLSLGSCWDTNKPVPPGPAGGVCLLLFYNLLTVMWERWRFPLSLSNIRNWSYKLSGSYLPQILIWIFPSVSSFQASSNHYIPFPRDMYFCLHACACVSLCIPHV